MLKFSVRIPKPTLVRLPLPIALITAASLALAAPAALADSATSSNWAGYAAHRPGAQFTKVVAAWTQPTATCARGFRTYSATWVGLGGFDQSSNALEQIGTEVDCTASGSVSSSAWFELVPAPSQPVRLRVRPGDGILASVTVSGHQAVLSLYDATTKQSFKKTLHASVVDVSSAEWIVEAPSQCISNNSCQTLPLADFSATAFAFAQARSVAGHTGAISDPAWDSTKIRLEPGGRRFVLYNGAGATAGVATPSALSGRGTSFNVTFSAVTLQGRPFAAARRPALQAGYILHPGR
jgi:hypothetical protein